MGSVLQLCYADRYADLTVFVGVPHFPFSFLEGGGRALVQLVQPVQAFWTQGVPVWRSSFLFVRIPFFTNSFYANLYQAKGLNIEFRSSFVRLPRLLPLHHPTSQQARISSIHRVPGLLLQFPFLFFLLTSSYYDMYRSLGQIKHQTTPDSSTCGPKMRSYGSTTQYRR